MEQPPPGTGRAWGTGLGHRAALTSYVAEANTLIDTKGLSTEGTMSSDQLPALVFALNQAASRCLQALRPARGGLELAHTGRGETAAHFREFRELAEVMWEARILSRWKHLHCDQHPALRGSLRHVAA